MFYNLQGAYRVSMNKERLSREQIEKSSILQAVEQKLSEAETPMMLATGAPNGGVPVVSNVEAFRASHKSTADAQEKSPMDLREQRTKRKQEFDVAHKNLAAVRTPLVEANRPNKKRKSEAGRHQKNYKAATKKTKIPKSIHSSLKSFINQMNLDWEDFVSNLTV